MRKHFEAILMPSFGYSTQEAMFGLCPAKPCQHCPLTWAEASISLA
jgi:hypothetical protein